MILTNVPSRRKIKILPANLSELSDAMYDFYGPIVHHIVNCQLIVNSRLNFQAPKSHAEVFLWI